MQRKTFRQLPNLYFARPHLLESWRALLSGNCVTNMNLGKGREQERKLCENSYIACYAQVSSLATELNSIAIKAANMTARSIAPSILENQHPQIESIFHSNRSRYKAIGRHSDTEIVIITIG